MDLVLSFSIIYYAFPPVQYTFLGFKAGVWCVLDNT